jgi:hypothetical protein
MQRKRSLTLNHPESHGDREQTGAILEVTYVQRAIGDKPFDEIAEAQKSYLRECALLLLGALTANGAFPADLEDIAALIERTAEPEPGIRRRRFAVESPDDSTGPSGGHYVWVSPTDDGALRLRVKHGLSNSIAVVLHPDGELGEFAQIEAPPAPEPEGSHEAEVSLVPEDETRFSNEHLAGVRSAPSNELNGLSVTWIALYDKGVILHYLVPSPDEEGEGPIELSDNLGTNYAPIGIGDVDLGVPPLRSLEFAPAVPAGASRLTVAVRGEEVEVPVAR